MSVVRWLILTSPLVYSLALYGGKRYLVQHGTGFPPSVQAESWRLVRGIQAVGVIMIGGGFVLSLNNDLSSYLPLRFQGFLLTAAGLSLSLLAHKELATKWLDSASGKEHLVTSGPCDLVRHPHFGGILIAFIGLSLLTFHLYYACGLLAIASVLSPELDAEDQFLHKRFGKAYDDYAADTGRFLPRRHRRSAS